MLLSSQLPLSSLIEVSRVLRHNLGAGLRLVDVFRQLEKRGPTAARPMAGRILDALKRGASFQEALEAEQACFPPLFVSMALIGEESGMLPEIFAEMEKYYLLQQRLKRQFLTQIAWPAFQFLAGIFVIAIMLWALGLVADLHGGAQTVDPIGVGLGTAGAVRWLLLSFGTLGAIAAVYLLASRNLHNKAIIDSLLLRVPLLGTTLEALALQRFCLALRMVMETGMPVTTALRLSMRATGNAAFEARTDLVVQGVRSGDDLTVALANTRLFPYDFRNIVAVAEEGGRLVEVLRHQADYYEEEASRRMKLLTQAAAGGVWLCVAGLIIFMIFRIFITAILPAYSAAGI
jgi:type II secretory pathway component PulF